MRFVFISDTHGKHRDIQVPPGDVLVHCGDMSMRGRMPEVSDFEDWGRSLPHRHKILIAGNHDFGFEKEEYSFKMAVSSWTYLKDSWAIVSQFKIYGSPWQPEFHNWAFNLPRGSDRMRRVWANVPSDTDILVTHGPPYGVLDVVPNRGHQGCRDLRDQLPRIKPMIHAFGHIHEGYGVTQGIPDLPGTEKIGFINCSLMNNEAGYKPINRPVVIDVQKDGLIP